MQSSEFLQSIFWRKAVVFFRTFQSFSIRKQLITWMVVWRSAPTEHTSVLIWISNPFLFITVYHCNLDHDGIFTSLQKRCRRKNSISVGQIGLKYSMCGIVCSSWWLLVWHFPGFNMIYFNKLANDAKVLGW